MTGLAFAAMMLLPIALVVLRHAATHRAIEAMPTEDFPVLTEAELREESRTRITSAFNLMGDTVSPKELS